MRLSFKVWPHLITWPDFRDFWIEADANPAYRSGWIYDHFVPQTGWHAHEPLDDEVGPCFEAWTLLAHIAALTQRVRFGTLVSSITHRHPSVMAKAITTLDELSQGRVEVGIGAGWNAPEHVQFGIPFPSLGERFDCLDEYLTMLDGLMRPGTFSFDGEHYRCQDAYCLPASVQAPRPPLTVGGKGPKRALPLVAKWADHWNFPSGTIEEFVEKRGLLAELCTGYGRDIAGIDISTQVKFVDLDEVLRSIEQYNAAGSTHAVVWFNPPMRPADLSRLSDAVSRNFDLTV